MKQEIFKISKHTTIYTIGVILNKSVSFIMLPVYTRYLTPADYGTIELLTSTIDIITMIVGMGLTSAIFKFYAEYETQESKNNVISTAVIMLLVVSVITTIAGIVFSDYLSNIIFNQAGQFSYYFKIIFLIYLLQQGTIAIPLMFIRAAQNSTKFVVLNLIKVIIHVSLIVFFLVIMKKGVVGLLYSTLIADLFLGLYLIFSTFRVVGFKFSMQKAKKIAKFGYPFILVSLSGFVLTYSDRYFLNVYSDLFTVGIYSLAYKFGFILGYLAVSPFLQIWELERLEIAKKKDAARIFTKVFTYFNIGLLLSSIVITLFVKDVLLIMSEHSFHSAYRIVPIIIAAYVIQAWTFYCNIGIYLKDGSKHMAFATMLSAGGVFLLNFILIPKYHAFGAAWATFGAFLLRFYLVYVFSQRLYYIDYGWSKQFSLVIFSIGIYFVYAFINIQNILLSAGLNVFLVSLFLLLTYIFILDSGEKAMIKTLVRHPGDRIRLRLSGIGENKDYES